MNDLRQLLRRLMKTAESARIAGEITERLHVIVALSAEQPIHSLARPLVGGPHDEGVGDHCPDIGPQQAAAIAKEGVRHDNGPDVRNGDESADTKPDQASARDDTDVEKPVLEDNH